MRSVLFSLFLTLALAGGAAGLAFIAGRSSADASGSFERGVDEGERLGRAQARAEFVPGSTAYRAAVERGRKAGFADGRRAGRSEGRRKGRALAFAGFDGGWEVGRWYIVAIAPAGETGGDVGINARVAVRRGVAYGLCPGRSRICASGGVKTATPVR